MKFAQAKGVSRLVPVREFPARLQAIFGLSLNQLQGRAPMTLANARQKGARRLAAIRLASFVGQISGDIFKAAEPTCSPFAGIKTGKFQFIQPRAFDSRTKRIFGVATNDVSKRRDCPGIAANNPDCVGDKGGNRNLHFVSPVLAGTYLGPLALVVN